MSLFINSRVGATVLSMIHFNPQYSENKFINCEASNVDVVYNSWHEC